MPIPTVPNIQTTTLLTEETLAEQFLAGIARRSLDEKFFYWFPLSVRAWLELCSDGDYRNFVRSRSLIESSAKELAAKIPPNQIDVFSIGCGQGDKDGILLQALRESVQTVNYLPTDASQSLLEIACAGALKAGFAVRGFKADFTDPAHLQAIAHEGDSSERLFMMIGNTMGAADPLSTAKDLRRMLRPGDLLLVDGEIYSPGTIAGYDNPINRRFAWAPLYSVGIRDDQGEVAFRDEIDDRLPGLHLVSKHFSAAQPVVALTGGKSMKIEAGQRLEMNHSYKYSLEAFDAVLDQAGLEPKWSAQSEDGKFVMTLAEARNPN
ncbi:MAG: L-histidine N(alpha)-methyltransferase [Actinomycetota bacterium]